MNSNSSWLIRSSFLSDLSLKIWIYESQSGVVLSSIAASFKKRSGCLLYHANSRHKLFVFKKTARIYRPLPGKRRNLSSKDLFISKAQQKLFIGLALIFWLTSGLSPRLHSLGVTAHGPRITASTLGLWLCRSIIILGAYRGLTPYHQGSCGCGLKKGSSAGGSKRR